MCFSSSASFVASAALFTVGVASIKAKSVPAQMPFAIIPLLFAFQQLCEGFLWLSFTNSEFSSWEKPSTYLFLIIAQIVWPFWVPYSILLFEKDDKRKKILTILLVIGCFVSCYILYCLLSFPVQAQISRHHIRYITDFPYQYNYVASLLYLLPTVIPPFISATRKMQLLGTTILISFIISRLFFKETLVSVWCYFAAILSITIYLILKDQGTEKVSKVSV